MQMGRGKSYPRLRTGTGHYSDVLKAPAEHHNHNHKEIVMLKMKFALTVSLLFLATATGLAFANMPAPEEPGGGSCGAWEWLGGTSFRRSCVDGSLHWYEYR